MYTLKDIPISGFNNKNNGTFVVSYSNGSYEPMQRIDLLKALEKGHMNESEATAFKYADCLPFEFHKAN